MSACKATQFPISPMLKYPKPLGVVAPCSKLMGEITSVVPFFEVSMIDIFALEHAPHANLADTDAQYTVPAGPHSELDFLRTRNRSLESENEGLRLERDTARLDNEALRHCLHTITQRVKAVFSGEKFDTEFLRETIRGSPIFSIFDPKTEIFKIYYDPSVSSEVATLASPTSCHMRSQTEPMITISEPVVTVSEPITSSADAMGSSAQQVSAHPASADIDPPPTNTISQSAITDSNLALHKSDNTLGVSDQNATMPKPVFANPKVMTTIQEPGTAESTGSATNSGSIPLTTGPTTTDSEQTSAMSKTSSSSLKPTTPAFQPITVKEEATTQPDTGTTLEKQATIAAESGAAGDDLDTPNKEWVIAASSEADTDGHMIAKTGLNPAVSDYKPTASTDQTPLDITGTSTMLEMKPMLPTHTATGEYIPPHLRHHYLDSSSVQNDEVVQLIKGGCTIDIATSPPTVAANLASKEQVEDEKHKEPSPTKRQQPSPSKQMHDSPTNTDQSAQSKWKLKNSTGTQVYTDKPTGTSKEVKAWDKGLANSRWADKDTAKTLKQKSKYFETRFSDKHLSKKGLVITIDEGNEAGKPPAGDGFAGSVDFKTIMERAEKAEKAGKERWEKFQARKRERAAKAIEEDGTRVSETADVETGGSGDLDLGEDGMKTPSNEASELYQDAFSSPRGSKWGSSDDSVPVSPCKPDTTEIIGSPGSQSNTKWS